MLDMQVTMVNINCFLIFLPGLRPGESVQPSYSCSTSARKKYFPIFNLSFKCTLGPVGTSFSVRFRWTWSTETTCCELCWHIFRRLFPTPPSLPSRATCQQEYFCFPGQGVHVSIDRLQVIFHIFDLKGHRGEGLFIFGLFHELNN